MDAAPATAATQTPSTVNQQTLVRILRWLPVVLAVGVFLAIALQHFTLPGFYYDEALDLVPMLHVMRGEQPELLRNIGIGPLPVMLLDYMGSLGGYITVPFMAIFGPGVVAARAQPIFFSAVTIVLAWLLARRWFGDWVAAVTVLLLAVNPSFIWFSRQGISVTSVMTVFSLGSLLLLSKPKLENGKLRKRTILNSQFVTCLFAGVLLGLGLWAKFLFFRWIAALIVMGVIFFIAHENTKNKGKSLGLRVIASLPALLIIALGFVIGAAPLLYYNIVGLVRDGQPWTFALLLNSLFNPTQQFGVNNLNFGANIQKSIDDVRVFIDGSYFWYNGVPFSNVYAVPALLISLVIGGVLAVARRKTDRAQTIRFFALLAAMVVLVFLGAFTVSGLWSTHQFIMLPLPQMIVACAAVWLAELLGRLASSHVGRFRNLQPANLQPLTLLVVLLLTALPFTRDLWVNEQHHAILAKTGGSGRFSDAVYKLADWLDQSHISQPIALDWGIEKQVRVLTADRVRPLEIFGYSQTADDAFRQRAQEMLADKNHSYIVLWDRFAVYNRRQAFTEIANQMGLQVVETFIAHEKSGLPVYVVLQAK